MHIDRYAFGSMVVDGASHTNDLILLPDRIHDHWWRQEGHRLSPADLGDVFEAEPEILVVGTGAYGVMKVPADTRRAVESAGIELVAARTEEAAQEYNELADAGRRVAGAFHLTC